MAKIKAGAWVDKQEQERRKNQPPRPGTKARLAQDIKQAADLDGLKQAILAWAVPDKVVGKSDV